MEQKAQATSFQNAFNCCKISKIATSKTMDVPTISNSSHTKLPLNPALTNQHHYIKTQRHLFEQLYLLLLFVTGDLPSSLKLPHDALKHLLWFTFKVDPAALTSLLNYSFSLMQYWINIILTELQTYLIIYSMSNMGCFLRFHAALNRSRDCSNQLFSKSVRSMSLPWQTVVRHVRCFEKGPTFRKIRLHWLTTTYFAYQTRDNC